MNWIMNVPVLSTAHMPSIKAIKKYSEDYLTALQITDEDFVCFCYIPFDPIWLKYHEWVIPIAHWVDKHHPNDRWIRFDVNGDEIPGLPIYEHE